MISDTNNSNPILTNINLDMKFNLIHSKMFDLEKKRKHFAFIQLSPNDMQCFTLPNGN